MFMPLGKSNHTTTNNYVHPTYGKVAEYVFSYKTENSASNRTSLEKSLLIVNIFYNFGFEITVNPQTGLLVLDMYESGSMDHSQMVSNHYLSDFANPNANVNITLYLEPTKREVILFINNVHFLTHTLGAKTNPAPVAPASLPPHRVPKKINLNTPSALATNPTPVPEIDLKDLKDKIEEVRYLHKKEGMGKNRSKICSSLDEIMEILKDV